MCSRPTPFAFMLLTGGPSLDGPDVLVLKCLGPTTCFRLQQACCGFRVSLPSSRLRRILSSLPVIDVQHGDECDSLVQYVKDFGETAATIDGLALLVFRGVDVNEQDRLGWTPLVNAAARTYLEPSFYRALIFFGADPKCCAGNRTLRDLVRRRIDDADRFQMLEQSRTLKNVLAVIETWDSSESQKQ